MSELVENMNIKYEFGNYERKDSRGAEGKKQEV